MPTSAATTRTPPPVPDLRPDDGVRGLRVVFRIFEQLGITADEGRTLLGQIPRGTYYRWRRTPDKATIGPDLIERLSYLLGIYKSICILVPDTRQQAAFFRRPNSHPVCGGQTPLAMMLGGRVADLYRMRQWLDGERGG